MFTAFTITCNLQFVVLYLDTEKAQRKALKLYKSNEYTDNTHVSYIFIVQIYRKIT